MTTGARCMVSCTRYEPRAVGRIADDLSFDIEGSPDWAPAGDEAEDDTDPDGGR